MTQQQPSEDSWNLQDGTVDDLREAVVANLEHRGVMGKLRAKVISGSKRAKAHRVPLVVTLPTSTRAGRSKSAYNVHGFHSIAVVDALARTSVVMHISIAPLPDGTLAGLHEASRL